MLIRQQPSVAGNLILPGNRRLYPPISVSFTLDAGRLHTISGEKAQIAVWRDIPGYGCILE
jgi:hypothetical protein